MVDELLLKPVHNQTQAEKSKTRRLIRCGPENDNFLLLEIR